MFKQIFMGASAALAAAVIPASSAFAATSGDLEGRMRVPYACAIETPPVQTLIPDESVPNTAYAYETWSFSHNDETTYSLSPLTILASNANASLQGRIALTDGTDIILDQDAEAGSVSTQFTGTQGNYASVGRGEEGAPQVAIALAENVASVFWAGDYRIISTVSCAQNTERGTLF